MFRKSRALCKKRRPSSHQNYFLVYLTDLLKNPIFVNKDIFKMVDFDIDNLKHNNNISHEFLEIFLTASFLPLISTPTRMANHSATLIDNVFCNTFPTPDSSVILFDITDHFPIMSHFTLKHSLNNLHRPSRRRPNHENIASLGASLDSANWSCVYDNLSLSKCHIV